MKMYYMCQLCGKPIKRRSNLHKFQLGGMELVFCFDCGQNLEGLINLIIEYFTAKPQYE